MVDDAVNVKAEEAGRVVVDGDRWLRRLGMPYFTLAILREMRVGDEVILLDYDGPSILPGGEPPGRVGASIEKVRGGNWYFSALWMLHVGHATRRPHIFTFGTFRVETGRRLSWEGKDTGAMRSFERVVRLSVRLARMARFAGDRTSARRMEPYPWLDHDFTRTDVPFLTTIAAAPLGTGPGEASR
ncbi:hypothetical protein WM24_27335 [Burkholderia ubonensis]|uniref:hypothetical protein n=1 Tax=Burkholderia ubonensis TaxID=101571 RepID=UPI0007565F56|nr:hypothetical protein [Burkholderia ubonensis]KWN79237.1 hypothetical protein WM24_27335 [Burkholderia ubonensis]